MKKALALAADRLVNLEPYSLGEPGLRKDYSLVFSPF